MAPYVYDFGVQDASSVGVIQERNVQRNSADASTKPAGTAANPQVLGESSIGAFAGGNPDVRHDGVTLTSVIAGGPADRAGIKAGDVILAINDRYLFTAGELMNEVSHRQPGTTIMVRYRRYSTIYDASVVVGQNR
jgi:S1-C subfamily serine protease